MTIFTWRTPATRKSSCSTSAGRYWIETRDHKPDSIDEKKRIELGGGHVTPKTSHQVARVNGPALSRAFGDFYSKFKEYERKTRSQTINRINLTRAALTSLPDVTHIRLRVHYGGAGKSKGDQIVSTYALIASDGLFDVMTPREAVQETLGMFGNGMDLVETRDRPRSASIQEKESADNVTALVARIV